MKNIIIISLTLTFMGCSSGPAGIDKLKELCEKDAGLGVHEKVEASGYYDATTNCHHCWHGLINSPFDYIEFCDYESDRNSLTYILTEHGCYRLSKVKRSSGQCHTGVDSDVKDRVIEPYVSFKEDQCIKVEKLDKPESRLGLFLQKDKKMITKRDFDISRYEYTIKTLNDNKIYGYFINYSLVVKTVGGAGYSCDSSAVTGQRVSVKNPSFYKAFISKVIEVKE